MNPTVRYGLTNDARVWKDKKEVFLNTRVGEHFIDLLEPLECEGICKQIKINVFCPDGTIIKEATVTGACICIKNKDSLFDGRFNALTILQ